MGGWGVVAADTEKRLALPGRIQEGSAKMLKEALESQVPYLDSALVVAGLPGDFSAAPVIDPGHPRPESRQSKEPFISNTAKRT